MFSDGARRPHIALAVPIYEGGKFVDPLLNSRRRVVRSCYVPCAMAWYDQSTTRLHTHPLDWVEAGCKGVCHLEPISRKALKDLRAATTTECNDIHTALQAWDWGFGGEDEELARFVIDDTAESIRSYFEDEVKWRTRSLAVVA